MKQSIWALTAIAATLALTACNKPAEAPKADAAKSDAAKPAAGAGGFIGIAIPETHVER